MQDKRWKNAMDEEIEIIRKNYNLEKKEKSYHARMDIYTCLKEKKRKKKTKMKNKQKDKLIDAKQDWWLKAIN